MKSVTAALLQGEINLRVICIAVDGQLVLGYNCPKGQDIKEK